ncbi:MAG TPA: outer membrane beta-barrel protein, partial [Hyphomicrobiaceae bacterium]|nr:outer membrane beta-barrel protein [Hyphomicrobiaceae bacterium]
ARAFDDGSAIEIEPILDRRPARLARFEPYDPIGLRWGQFIVFPEIETAAVGRSNMFRSSASPAHDVGLEARPSVRVVSNWRVHALEFRANAVTSFWNRFPSEDDRAYAFETRGRLDITRRTNIEALVGYQVEQEARGSVNAAAGADDRTDVVTSRAAVTLNHRFNRLSIQLRGSVVDNDYQPVAAATGAIISNDARDLRTSEAAVRATWELKPALLVFAESAFNWRTYDEAPASDGIRRDSSGDRIRLGVSFGNSGQIIRGEASIGYGTQRPDDHRLPEIAGILIDANLAWRVSALTSILFTARTDVSESSVAGAGGALARSGGVEVRHAFLRNLVTTGALRYTLTDYEGVSLAENELVAAMAAEYFLSRELTLFARYQHTEFDSTDAARNYNLDEVRVGVRVRR